MFYKCYFIQITNVKFNYSPFGFQLYPRRTVWLFVIQNVLMTLSGIFQFNFLSIEMFIFTFEQIFVIFYIKEYLENFYTSFNSSTCYCTLICISKIFHVNSSSLSNITTSYSNLLLYLSTFEITFFYIGKSPQLYQHDLLQIYAKQSNKFSLPMNRIPEKFVPRYDQIFLIYIFLIEFSDVLFSCQF